MEEKKTYHHKNLKNKLIENGIRLVDEEGIKAFSLRKVANACGVSHAAPYSHFQNKEELLAAMQNYITDEFSRILEETIHSYENQPDVLELLGKAYVAFFVKNPHYFSFLFTQSNLKIDLTFCSGKGLNFKPFEIFKDLALHLMNQAGYPKEKQKDAVIALWSFIHGIACIATMKNVCYDENWEDKVTNFIGVLRCSFLKEMKNAGQ